jgi:hypothetical protein
MDCFLPPSRYLCGGRITPLISRRSVAVRSDIFSYLDQIAPVGSNAASRTMMIVDIPRRGYSRLDFLLQVSSNGIIQVKGIPTEHAAGFPKPGRHRPEYSPW